MALARGESSFAILAPVEGRNVVVIGRGLTIGRPLALLMSMRRPGCDAAVTVVHEGAFYQGELRMFRPGQERPHRPAQPAPEATQPAPTAGIRASSPAGTPARRRPGELAGNPVAKEETDQDADRTAAVTVSPAGNGNGRHPLAAEAR